MLNAREIPEGTVLYIQSDDGYIYGTLNKMALTNIKFVNDNCETNITRDNSLIGYRVVNELQYIQNQLTCFIDLELCKASIIIQRYNKIQNKLKELKSSLHKQESILEDIKPKFSQVQEKYAEYFI